MSEPIIYALKLASYNETNLLVSGVLNNDVTYDVGRFFAKIAAVHGVNKCKIELVGAYMFSDDMQLIGSTMGAIDLVVKMPGIIGTSYNSNGIVYPTLCCLMSYDGGALKNEALKIQYKAPIYCSDIGNITQIEIIQYDGYSNFAISTYGSDAVPTLKLGSPYSLMLHVTPIYN